MNWSVMHLPGNCRFFKFWTLVMMHFIKMSICYYFEILIPVFCSMNQLNKNIDIMPFDSVNSSSLQKIAKVILNLLKSSWREQMMPTIFSVWVQLQVLHLQVRFKLLLFNVPIMKILQEPIFYLFISLWY